MRFDEAVKVIDSFYDEGGRCLYLEGGEPFIPGAIFNALKYF
jgi:hypothetical protein